MDLNVSLNLCFLEEFVRDPRISGRDPEKKTECEEFWKISVGLDFVARLGNE